MCLELSRAVGGFFESRSHVLQGVADLAALTPTEVRNFLAEGSLWTRDPRTVFGCAAGVRVHDSDGKESLPVPPHTSRDCAIHMQDEAEAESAAVAVAAAVDVTVQDITAALRRLITECLNSKLAQHRNSPFNAVYANLKGDDRVSRAAVPSLLYIVRKLFYEAQVLNYSRSISNVEYINVHLCQNNYRLFTWKASSKQRSRSTAPAYC